MANSPREELLLAEALMEKGEYAQVFEIVETLSLREGLDEDDKLYCSLLKSQSKLRLGELADAEKLANEILQRARKHENLLLLTDLLIVKIEIYWRSSRFDEGLAVIKDAEEVLNELESKAAEKQVIEVKERKAGLLRHKGILHWYKGELDLAAENHNLSLEIFRELDNKKGIASCLNNLGLIQWSKGNLDEAAKHYKKSLTIQQEQENKEAIATILGNLGNIYSLKGEIEQALDYQQRSLKIREELGNKSDVALALINTGTIYQMKGDLKRALDYYYESLGIFKQLDVKHNIALAFNNLGSIYQIIGDLDQAIEYHQQSLAIKQKLGNKQEIALSLFNIAEIHQKKGELVLALKKFHQSLSLYEEVGNESYASVALYGLVSVALDSGQSDLAKQYLQQLSSYSEDSTNRVIDQRYRVAKALSLKSSKQVRDKLQAQEILATIVDEEVADHSLTVAAMIQLCDLLLFELKMTEEEELLKKAKDVAHQLLDIGKKQSSFSLLAETYILQSKLALVEQNIEEARILMAQAHIMAQEKGLHMLARKVAHERDLLQTQLDKWQRIIEENPSRGEMIDLAHLDDYLERMVKKTVAVLTKEEKLTFGEEAAKRKYKLDYIDLIKNTGKTEQSNFRIGIAQIGLSKSGDILSEVYEEKAAGLLGIREDKIKALRSQVKKIVAKAHENGINVLLLPEMTIDLNYKELAEDVEDLAKEYQMYIIPGSYHEQNSKRNLCRIVGPSGILWEQEKHIPAIIHIEGKRFTEGIDVGSHPRKTIVCNTEFGRIAIAICRDFLDMDLRVELKNFDPPVDLVFNPAFTPVTADFDAAHFDARRSIYAYCCFANVAEYGDSFIYTPEKEREERRIAKGEENLIYKDVDLFRLRSERKKWEKEQKRTKPFIQSTRQ